MDWLVLDDNTLWIDRLACSTCRAQHAVPVSCFEVQSTQRSTNSSRAYVFRQFSCACTMCSTPSYTVHAEMLNSWGRTEPQLVQLLYTHRSMRVFPFSVHHKKKKALLIVCCHMIYAHDLDTVIYGAYIRLTAAAAAVDCTCNKLAHSYFYICTSITDLVFLEFFQRWVSQRREGYSRRRHPPDQSADEP